MHEYLFNLSWKLALLMKQFRLKSRTLMVIYTPKWKASNSWVSYFHCYFSKTVQFKIEHLYVIDAEFRIHFAWTKFVNNTHSPNPTDESVTHIPFFIWNVYFTFNSSWSHFFPFTFSTIKWIDKISLTTSWIFYENFSNKTFN